MATANTLDVFGDGSCVDLVTLDGNIDTVNNGSFTVVGDPATYVTGKYGQAYKGTLSTTVKMASPRILPTGKRTNSSISLWVRQRVVPSANAMILLYDDNDWGGVTVQYDTTEGYMVGVSDVDVVLLTVVTGVMHNIVIEFDAALNKMDVYVDKILKGSTAWTADREPFGVDECWLNGADFSGTEYRSEHDIDQIRFFNRPLSSAEREILFDEGSFGTIFRDRRVSMQGQSASFLDKREVTTTTGVTLFLDRRISMSGNGVSFKDRRELNAIEKMSVFLDKRLCTSNISTNSFLDKRITQSLHSKSFKDRREVETLHTVNFLDRRDIHKGGGIVFSDRRLVRRDFRYASFRDIRLVETEYKAIIIERTNI